VWRPRESSSRSRKSPCSQIQVLYPFAPKLVPFVDPTEAREREVLRRLAPGIRPDLIKAAGGDVLERRKPGWSSNWPLQPRIDAGRLRGDRPCEEAGHAKCEEAEVSGRAAQELPAPVVATLTAE